jgi:hypothetical protein
MHVKSRLQYQRQKLRNKVTIDAHAQETVIDCLSAALQQTNGQLACLLNMQPNEPIDNGADKACLW